MLIIFLYGQIGSIEPIKIFSMYLNCKRWLIWRTARRTVSVERIKTDFQGTFILYSNMCKRLFCRMIVSSEYQGHGEFSRCERWFTSPCPWFIDRFFFFINFIIALVLCIVFNPEWWLKLFRLFIVHLHSKTCGSGRMMCLSLVKHVSYGLNMVMLRLPTAIAYDQSGTRGKIFFLLFRNSNSDLYKMPQ